nr:chromate transporter [uncultured Duganella sp.]
MHTQTGALTESARQPSPTTIFFVFSRLALMGFGGVMPFAYRALVEQHKWLTAEEFAKYMAMSQMLPGPTVCNVGLMVGNRYAGVAGALAAVAGLILGPFFIIVGLGMVYQRFGDLEIIRRAIGGMAAVAAGLILATAAKMALSMFAKAQWHGRRDQLKLVMMVLAFIALGLLKWQLALVFCVLAPLGTACAYLLGDRHE